MYLRIAPALVALLAIGSAAASAATVSPIGGETRVSIGLGFEQISGPRDFPAGAQVMVSPQGSAQIAYSSTCVVTVKPGGVSTIFGRSPCEPLPRPYHFGFEQVAAPAAAETFGFTPKVGSQPKPISSSTSSESSAPPPPPAAPVQQQTASNDDNNNVYTSCLIIGGVVLGAGALAAVLISQNDSSTSP
jgi:hypothetical protein